MTVFAQHGYGKSDKINRGLDAGNLKGVILSPKDEGVERLEHYINELSGSYPDIEIMVDPQFYVSTISEPKLGHLEEYPYFESELSRLQFIKPTDIRNYVKNTLDYQLRTSVTRILTPTVMVDNLSNPWSQIALSLAMESVEYYSRKGDSRPLYISLCIDEIALTDKENLDEYLDMLSILEVDGFYIIVKREKTGMISSLDPIRLSNLMYFTHVLANYNEYDVVFGYTDLLGLPLFAAGSSAVSSGWFNTLKCFNISRFQPSSGGRRPRARYTSKSLINSILVIPELSTIYDAGRIEDVILGNLYDSRMKNNPASATWPQDVHCLHNWSVLDSVCQDIEEGKSIFEKMDILKSLVLESIELHKELKEVVPFDTSFAHLLEWNQAIDEFKKLL